MFKFILISTVAIFNFSTLKAETLTTSVSLDRVLEAEIKKDLSGMPSCFKGKIKELKSYMEENYGGRFSGEHELEITEVSSTQYRASAKYCEKSLDINLNEVINEEDVSLIAYRQCTSTDTSMNIAVIRYGSATSGTFETESATFAIDYKVTNKLIVDKNASYHPEEEEIKSWDTSSKLSCKLIEI